MGWPRSRPPWAGSDREHGQAAAAPRLSGACRRAGRFEPGGGHLVVRVGVAANTQGRRRTSGLRAYPAPAETTREHKRTGLPIGSKAEGSARRPPRQSSSRRHGTARADLGREHASGSRRPGSCCPLILGVPTSPAERAKRESASAVSGEDRKRASSPTRSRASHVQSANGDCRDPSPEPAHPAATAIPLHRDGPPRRSCPGASLICRVARR